MDAIYSQWQQDLSSFELLDDARNGFEAQRSDISNILASGQNDPASMVGEQAHKAEDTICSLSTA